MSTRITQERERRPGSLDQVVRWVVESFRGPGSVNLRMIPLWRPDNRYPGTMMLRQHETGGVEMSFDALRHGGKPRAPLVVPPEHVDHMIETLLEIRRVTDPPAS